MRTNLTKKDLVNLVYMQLGFSKQIAENLIDDFLSTIVSSIKNEKKLKLSKFGTFSIRQKNLGLEEILRQKKQKKFQAGMLFCLNHQKNLKNLLI